MLICFVISAPICNVYILQSSLSVEVTVAKVNQHSEVNVITAGNLSWLGGVDTTDINQEVMKLCKISAVC